MKQHQRSINLKARSYLLLIIFAISSTVSFAGNPFLHMIGRTYAENMMELRQIYYELDFMDQSRADSLKAYMEEAASVANDHFWKLEQKSFHVTYSFRYNSRMAPNSTYTLTDAIRDIKEIYKEAKQLNDTVYYTKVLRGLMNAYIMDKDYDQAFETAVLIDKSLERISVSRQPEKVMVYREIAELHYRFRNYPEAELFFNKIVREPEANRYLTLRPAYNGLGLIYRYHYNDYKKSDEYFRKILAVPGSEYCDDGHLLAWKGIAKGNLGNNLYLQKRYAEAIPLLEFSRATMVKANDYTFASSMSALLADIYLEQKKSDECKRYIDMTVNYIRRSYPDQIWVRIYPVMAKYYAVVGNSTLAQAYQDSALAYQRKEFQEYDALKLLYAEQRQNRLERQANEDALVIERTNTDYYKRVALCIGIGLLVIAGLLFYALVLFRRQRSAHRTLVKKSQEWAAERKRLTELTVAGISPESAEGQEEVVLQEAELTLMERIHSLMVEERVYTDVNFNQIKMADLLGVNRTYISGTINRCTKKSFTQYINEFRVSEAIDIMSAKENLFLTINVIAFSSGFTDRKSFYRAFKKMTGLAPSDFRDNLPEND